jgi:hypothetical protein
MNPTNEQELRERIEQCFSSNVEESSESIELFDTDRVIADIATFITTYTNAEIAKALDRLEAQWGETIDNTLGKPIRVRFVSVEAIQAERAKLKEVK